MNRNINKNARGPFDQYNDNNQSRDGSWINRMFYHQALEKLCVISCSPEPMLAHRYQMYNERKVFERSIVYESIQLQLQIGLNIYIGIMRVYN